MLPKDVICLIHSLESLAYRLETSYDIPHPESYPKIQTNARICCLKRRVERLEAAAAPSEG